MASSQNDEFENTVKFETSGFSPLKGDMMHWTRWNLVRKSKT